MTVGDKTVGTEGRLAVLNSEQHRAKAGPGGTSSFRPKRSRERTGLRGDRAQLPVLSLHLQEETTFLRCQLSASPTGQEEAQRPGSEVGTEFYLVP